MHLSDHIMHQGLLAAREIDLNSGVNFCLVAAHCSAYFDKFSELLSLAERFCYFK